MNALATFFLTSSVFCIIHYSSQNVSLKLLLHLGSMVLSCSLATIGSYFISSSLSSSSQAICLRQWIRTHQPTQGTYVQSLVWEGSTCPAATKPTSLNHWALTLEPLGPNYWAHVLQLLKPARSRRRRNERPATRESPSTAMKTQCSQVNQLKKFLSA